MCGNFWQQVGLKTGVMESRVAQTMIVDLTFSADTILLFTGIPQPQQDQTPSIKESMGFLTTRSYGNEI